IQEMRAYHAHLEKRHGLAPKAVLEGFSRGGLYAFNYAAAHPDKVAALYLDAPVLDIRSWPGGKGKGIGNPKCWDECLAIYGLTEQTLPSFRGSPLDQVEKVAKARIPIISVCGGADESVPFEENTAILEERCRQLGGVIEVILKKDCGHHPHSLPDPAPITDFILRHARP
ncbi:MAG TPA: alpha/beta hydrolase, partial [Candidatus Brocadiia bacterium]|nr:alpha/beta hydrolase [Candidatus Brocadiia bacterium]